MDDFQFYSDKHVNKLQLYIEENFALIGVSKQLVRNILDYVASQGEDGETSLDMLKSLLDGLDISKSEIVKAVTGKKYYHFQIDEENSTRNEIIINEYKDDVRYEYQLKTDKFFLLNPYYKIIKEADNDVSDAIRKFYKEN